MKNEKKKMRSKTYNTIWCAVLAVLVVLALAVNLVTDHYRASLDNYVGKGERTVKIAAGSEGWDTNYYDQKFSSITEAREQNSAAVALKIAEEGITLMKNNDVLPLEKGAAVTPYGLRYVDPIFGGVGTGNVDVSMDYVDTAVEVMNEYFTIDSTVQSKLDSATHYYLPAPAAPGAVAESWTAEKPVTSSSTMFEYHSWMDEFNPAEVYDDAFLSASQGTVGIVFLGRVGGESNDVYYGQNGAYADGSLHELQLNDRERETIRIAKANCEKVVVVLESSNVMEISELAAAEGELAVDAIVWVGGAGAKGFRGLAEVLTGEVNPSGHLPDTWMVSIFDDPVTTNFGEVLYNNLSYGGFNQALVEYDEGIYSGYRYYETVHDLNGTFAVNGQTLGYGELDEKGNIVTPGAITYPFGYGLSYGAAFEQEITSINNSDGTVTMTVKVTNTGTQAGKAVVQAYYSAPYTDLDIQYNIEKSTVNLLAYDKTDDIAAGSSTEVTLTFNVEDMASYCYTHDNGNGTTGCYMLEEGGYTITVRANSHTVLDTETVTVDETIWFDGSDDDHIRQSEKDAQDTAGGGTKAESYIAATNQFQESNDYMAAKTDTLTRASGKLENTAQAPTEDARTAPDGMLEQVDTAAHFDPATDEKLGNGSGSAIYAETAPATGADNGLTLSSLRGIPYDNPKWDELLDQLDLSAGSDVYSTLLGSAYSVGAFESVGKSNTTESDAPTGIQTMFGNPADNGCAWCSATILAATFNVDLGYEMGAAVAQECLAKGISAWYAPAMNGHRSPFAGRNFEYYSEDPIIAGRMGTAVVTGAADNGVSCVIKHLFLNDMESHRNHINTWANEQVMREIYLKPFELTIKNAFTDMKYISDDQGTVSTVTVRACNGIMTSMGNIGTEYCGTNYNLATNVLRGEMGFRGMIMTDMAENPNNSKDKLIRAGVDEYMWFESVSADSLKDYTSATAQTAFRNAVKHMCYMVVNSSAMQGVAPGTKVVYATSPWEMGVYALDVVVALVVVCGVIMMIRRSADAKKNPDRYKSGK